MSDNTDTNTVTDTTTTNKCFGTTAGVDADSEIFDAICSEEFQTLIRVDALNGIRKFHPVYVLGYDAEAIKLMRRSYGTASVTTGTGSADNSKQDVYRVGIYSIPNTDVLINRVGIAPSVMVLAPDIELTGVVHTFVKVNHVPVLRVQHKRSTLVQLPSEDYYGGVYETIAEDAIANKALWTRVLNIGLLVWLRTRGFRPVDDAVVSLRGTHAIRRSTLPKPEPSFTQFMQKQFERLGFGHESESVLSNMATAAESESSFDFGAGATASSICDNSSNISSKHSSSSSRRSWRIPVPVSVKSFPMHNIVQPNY